MIETRIQHLFVARHGDYDGSSRANPPLSNNGKAQARRLGEAIRTICGDLPITILCSPSQRTLETATIVGSMFEKEPVPDYCFWADDDHSPDYEQAMKLVLACDTPVVVVVSHAGVTRRLPNLFGKQVIDQQIDTTSVSCGQAWRLELTTKTLQLIN